jgi:hypothetical protein
MTLFFDLPEKLQPRLHLLPQEKSHLPTYFHFTIPKNIKKYLQAVVG